jgi:hypothetical protein
MLSNGALPCPSIMTCRRQHYGVVMMARVKVTVAIFLSFAALAVALARDVVASAVTVTTLLFYSCCCCH